MAAEFYNISLAEMDEFLTPQGFRKLEGLPNTHEVVYGKRVDAKGMALSLRVYTGIQGFASRGKGKDAIRISLFFRKDKDSEPAPIAGDRHVKRVKTWKQNLQARLDAWQDMLPTEYCPQCHSPLVVRERKADKHKFLGCAGWKNGCKYTRNLQAELPLK